MVRDGTAPRHGMSSGGGTPLPGYTIRVYSSASAPRILTPPWPFGCDSGRGAASVMDDDFNLLGALIAERYAVERVVAKGGYGVVYRATHLALDMPVALKVLRVPAGFSVENQRLFIKQFEDEAKIIARLHHPAIVRVLDRGVIVFQDYSEAPWMVLEWIDGVTLAEDLQRRLGRRSRSSAECLRLCRPVLEALAIAHADNVVHRDLKPGNLMLPTFSTATKSLGERASMPRMRVLDFGIAKVTTGPEAPGTGHTSTSAAMPAYTPRYAAPEQVSGTRTGPWTDVHALGLILTEMLVGRGAYTAEDKMELQIQVLGERRPTPGVHGVDVGPWEAVLTKAMSLRPADRYADAGALLRALDEAAAPSPVARELPKDVRGLRLVFLAPAGVPPPVLLERLPLVLGRSEEADVPLPFSSISREHAKLSLDGERLTIEDMGSSNGIQVNGERVTRAPLAAGDMVQLGVVEFRVARRGDSTVVIQKSGRDDDTPRASRAWLPVLSVVGGGLFVAFATVALVGAFGRRAPVERQRLASLQAPVDVPRVTVASRAVADVPPTSESEAVVERRTPLERAQRCRRVFSTEAERNDCVIRELRDGGSSELELRTLVAAYQATGQHTAAAGVMRNYIEQYPYGPMTGTFQQYLLRNNGN